jgi:cobalt-precorrin 5A hydrolase
MPNGPDITIQPKAIAIWALTSEGAALGVKIQRQFAGSRLFLGRHPDRSFNTGIRFERLGEALEQEFHRYQGHIFIMATGIVVRSLALLLQHKTKDPAVVVVDECGQHAVSLLSGHLGGANALARRVAACLGARPVITTATDLRGQPAIDLIAQERHLAIENASAIRHVSMALLEGRTIGLYDPYDHLAGALPSGCVQAMAAGTESAGDPQASFQGGPGVWVDDIQIDLPAEILILRPASLWVGVGCNRNTPAVEIRELLRHVLDQHGLAAASVAGLASIDLKADEKGLLDLAARLARPLRFFSRQQLATVPDVPSPSPMVEKHVGVKSVCEAAAILASENGHLIAPKQTTPNVTIAIARASSTSSV